MKRLSSFLLVASVVVAGTMARGAEAKSPAGIVVDDEEAQFTGEWVVSAKQAALIGPSYRHDNNRNQGQLTARFTPDLPAAGRYEVRLIYIATGNRASNVPVTVHSAEGETRLTINQSESVIDGGVPRALGVFDFAAGKTGAVVVSNAGANGFVVVDAVQFVPVAIAQAERSAKVANGFRASAAKATPSSQTIGVPASPVDAKLAARAKSEPVKLAADAKPADVDGKSYDLVVVGGTAGGISCAVRAAREGANVLLVNHTRHLGGMISNGLMQWDALYAGHRAPLFSELLAKIESYYRTVYGENSHDHRTARFSQEHYPLGWAEPHVAEREFNRLIAAEKRITVLLAHYPTSVKRDGALLRSVTLREYGGTKDVTVRGQIFADATYEGDLSALAKVPYRVGREARAEFGEEHAGVLFANIAKGPAPLDAAEGRLNIHPYNSKQGTIDPTSPYTADGAVQAYNYRFCVTRDPANQVALTAPPPGYNRDEYLHYERKSIATSPGPNKKSHMNSPILPGENHAYPEADWPTREKIIARHKNFALGLIWFLQNDESISPREREGFRQWGLPKDEFPDHGHIPYEMYVREARRIVGRHMYTEHDNSLAPGFARTPVMPDSVAITDWYMDSHSCTTNSRPGFKYDGKLILTEESRPGQIPYRSLLPQGVDNLLVPVCLSATHIAWGAVRLEPVWMQVGEAAGVAAAMALKRNIPPAMLDTNQLVRALCERRFMVSFFNDINVGGNETWIPMAEYFATRGFFHDYDARIGDTLKLATAKTWADGIKKLRAGSLDPNALARAVAEAERGEGSATEGEFAALLPQPPKHIPLTAKAPLTREKAVRMMWKLLPE